MRCKFCGSMSIHPDTQHVTFSKGKAVAGVAAIGVVGAAAGLIGKDQKGYRCSACGSFMDTPMDMMLEDSVNDAIRQAESGKSTATYEYYKKEYINIQANIPVKNNRRVSEKAKYTEIQYMSAEIPEASEINEEHKHSYKLFTWEPDCPVFVSSIVINTLEEEDILYINAVNQSKGIIRSAYFDVKVYDDTKDEIKQISCVYQKLSVDPGQVFPSKGFKLGTELAYTVEIVCNKVAMGNDEVWRRENTVESFVINDQMELSDKNFPRFKYVWNGLNKISSLARGSSLFLPVESDQIWQCICGQPVMKGQNCTRCGADYDALIAHMSQNRLIGIQQEAVKNRAAHRAKESMATYNEALNKKNAAIYNNAIALQKRDTEISLREALEEFKSISGYSDSETKAEECEKRIPELLKELEEKRIKKEQEDAERKARLEKQAQIDAEKAVAKKKKRNQMLSILTGVIAASIIVAIIMFKVVIPGKEYNEALALKDKGEYETALEICEKLNGYKDSTSLKYQLIRDNLNAGQTFYFGEYENEAIEWRILAKKDRKVFVVSVQGLEGKFYNDYKSSVTWSVCSLRTWLNEEFLFSAFSEEEQKLIQITDVPSSDNPRFGTSYGKVGKDQLFLLSIDEAEKYFSGDSDRVCYPSEHAKATYNSWRGEFGRGCSWWLRTPGENREYAAVVSFRGGISCSGYPVDCAGKIDGLLSACVRPAMWLDLSSY